MQQTPGDPVIVLVAKALFLFSFSFVKKNIFNFQQLWKITFTLTILFTVAN